MTIVNPCSNAHKGAMLTIDMYVLLLFIVGMTQGVSIGHTSAGL